uniref:Uncharacterized protein n=1 Tax=Tanacetum cinerariifolium TaxID=118510 RepID=A0A6L2K775_TANCI|nr:hypothetical protein [Tanacetum cinerariifolium]
MRDLKDAFWSFQLDQTDWMLNPHLQHTVNSIHPGLFKSEITKGILEEEWVKNVAKKATPTRTFGTGDLALTKFARFSAVKALNVLKGGKFPHYFIWIRSVDVAANATNAVAEADKRLKLLWIIVRIKMSRDVIPVGSTMWIPLLYRGEYSQWCERFMNYLKEQTDSESMINSIQNCDQSLPVIAQVSLARNAQNDALERQMCGSEYGEQDRKTVILYEYKTFKAIVGEQLLDTYLCYLQVINDLKMCGYKKDNCELNYRFLNNLQPEWKQYGTLMRQSKNLMDINIDALYNILKQNQGDVNDALGYKKKVVVVTSDPLALVAEEINVSKRKKKVVVSLDSEGSGTDDFSELKKITALLAKAFNRRKFYSKPTNNNLRTSSTSQSANKKQEFVKTDDKKVKKKADEKKRDMSKVKGYNCKKEGHFAKDCKKAKVKDYNYYKIKMLLAKKDSDEQVLFAKDQAWMESSSDSDQEINANMDCQLGNPIREWEWVGVVLQCRGMGEEEWEKGEQLQGKDDTIRKLQTHINIISMLNVKPTIGSSDKQALETKLTQLKDLITSVRIQNDGFKITVLTAENAKLKFESLSKMQSEPIVPEKPKVLAPGMYAISSKYIVPPRRVNRAEPTPLSKKKPMSKSDTRNHSTLPAKRKKAKRVEDHHRNLDKQNHVDFRLNVKLIGFVSNSNIICNACNESLVFANHYNYVVCNLKSVNVKTLTANHNVKTTKKVWKAKVVTVSLSGSPLDDISHCMISLLIINLVTKRLVPRESLGDNADYGFVKLHIVNYTLVAGLCLVLVPHNGHVREGCGKKVDVATTTSSLKSVCRLIRMMSPFTIFSIKPLTSSSLGQFDNLLHLPVNTIRPINTVDSKSIVTYSRPLSNAFKRGHSQVIRPYNKYSAYKKTIFNKWVNTVRVKDTTARERAIVIEYMGREANANSQQKEYKEKRVIDSGYSRHTTGNKCYLSDDEDYDGGFVSFRDGKGRISGKGKIKTGTLDFDDVYFDKELKYNLFNVSQMRDKKNNVLFTDIECLVLSSNFKLLDESQVLLRVPRKDNIYSVDLKSVVPTRGLTCLFAKATIDESNLWNKRLRHINYKTMNKLNSVAKRKNKKLIEAAKTILVDSKLPTTFWAEAVNTACYVLNRALVIKPHNKTPYELIRGRPLLIDFMKPFGCPVSILNTRDSLGKFDRKADEGFFFVRYSVISKAMRVFNKRTKIVEETLNIKFLENAPNVKGNGPCCLFDIGSLTISMNYEPGAARKQTNGIAGTKDNIVAGQAEKKKEPEQEYILIPIYTTDLLIFQGPKDSAVDAGKKATNVDESRVSDNDVEEEVDMNNVVSSYTIPDAPLNKFLKDHPKDQSTKWMSRVLFYIERWKMRYIIDFVVYQMDVNSAFLYVKIEDEVYVCQPPGFEDPNFHEKVYKLEKALYGLHQAPRVWYKTLSTYLMDNGFHRGQIDKTLFIQRHKDDILLVQVYVDDIIFGSTKKELGTEFEKLMHDKSMIRSLMYLTASKPDITFAVCACTRFQVTPKTSHLYDVKRIFRYLKGQPKLGLWYLRDSPFDLEAYFDSDYAGASLDRKSTIRVIPTIYTSCIKQFWTSAKVKTVNDDVRLQALVYGKNVIVNEASMRRDLRLDDAEGTACPPNDAIFKGLARTRRGKEASLPLFPNVSLLVPILW